MKKFLAQVLLLALSVTWAAGQDFKPLRIFIRANTKTHGPGQHDHPRFLEDWTKLLNERGAKATGKIGFPTGAELEKTDVLVFYSQEGGTIAPEDRANLDKFLKRGGGIVAIHDSVCGTDAQWFKTIIGGAWEHGKAKWLEGEVGMYFVDTEHPITRGISNFDFKDEIYYDLHMMPEARVLATSFHNPFIIAPQMWVYEKENYRSFVCIPGHEYSSFGLPHFRALLLRGIAWAGKRSDVDYLCTKEELGSLKYPEGGPTAPEKAAAKLALHPDFNISLVASEPLIEKAISMDFDEKGRVWVAETPEYPGGRTINKNDEPIAVAGWAKDKSSTGKPVEERKPKDRISWLEDTDGDGRMDKKTVFADGLELVTSLVFYKDGVIVAQAPDILWLRDSNGDGKCDMQGERVVLYTGFGTFDTHAVINNFRRGMDGWIYGAVGYSAGAPRSKDGRDLGRITAGVIRFKPDGSMVEQVASGSCNTWGFDFAPDFELFYTTATCGEHFLHVAMPEKAIARASVSGVRSSVMLADHQKIFPGVTPKRAPYVQIDLVGGFTASAGSCIYNGGAWPDRFNNSHFSGEATMCLLHEDVLAPSGATFVAKKDPARAETEFIAGSDIWFRPIHSRVGPDGALYVVDFYNQAAVHNDTRGPKHGARNAAVRPDRDHHLGRIWRVQHKQAKELPKVNLAGGNKKDWVAALNSPNGAVRMNAQRLIEDNSAADLAGDLQQVVAKGSGFGRINALWTLNNLGKLDEATLTAALAADDAALRKNGLRVIAENETRASDANKTAVLKALNDSDARVKMNALLALANLPASEDIAKAVVQSYPKLQDKHLEAAAVAVASKDPIMFLRASFAANDPAMLANYVPAVVKLLANKQDGAAAGDLVILLSKQPQNIDGLKQMALDSLSASLKPEVAPAWNDELKQALLALLKTNNRRLAGSALPLAARWDKDATLAAEMRPLVEPLVARLSNTAVAEDERGQLLNNLIGARRLHPNILPEVGNILVSSTASPALKRRALDALGSIPDAEAGNLLVENFLKVPFALRDPALGQIVKRTEWSQAFLSAIEAKKIDLNTLGPAAVHRLRSHPEKAVAERANKIIDDIRGPETKEKNALIAQFLPAVQQEGNIETGKQLFTQNCATCHKFKGEGKDLAPDLTGMGAHGPEDLLVHVLDPNRVVEPNFIAVNVETKDDLSFDGIVARENRSVLVLRNAAGDYEIQQDIIKARRASGMSLMPNGFESLGKDGLRDLIGYLCADEKRFRILDLRPAFTADSTKGIFISRESTNETLRFRNFGTIRVGEVPFDIINPIVSQNGNNLVVLKGGEGYAKTLPKKVEVKANVKANVLHFLGGVAGWGFPFGGEEKTKNTPAAKVTVHYAGGETEELTFRNGVEFADYNGKYDVPGSREVPDVLRNGQVRWFSKPLRKNTTIEKLALESFDGVVAPVFVSITAEQSSTPEKFVASSGAPATTAATPAAAALEPAQAPLKIDAPTLIVGGGSSHNFDRWFNKEDSATLAKAFVKVAYTDQPALITAETVEKLEVLYLSNNQPIRSKEVRDAIMARAEAGKGLLLVHPALWYNWQEWPEYNQKLVAGGARSHDKFGEFEV
ncbi:MAG TPA: PVC-type heme-binding CxxCH protein, partial [Verrucomicrobiae bacterium]|nr:PVC-type heme-binding CxxCH protein [Verrucomicrobiae bacterium]